MKNMTYILKTPKDVLLMEKKLRKEKYSNVFVAVELAQNMVEHSIGGTIDINGIRITTTTKEKSNIDIHDKINKAKSVKNNGIRGMGYRMILAAGWDIIADTSHNSLIISAIKHD